VFVVNLRDGAYLYLSLWWVSICHNEDRCSEVCSDVGVEPAIQPVEGEPLQFATANREDSDVVATDFWDHNRQCASFDIWVFNPFTCSYFHSNCPIVTSFMNMKNDGHMMSMLVREVERVCLQLLVSSATIVFRNLLLLCWLKNVYDIKMVMLFAHNLSYSICNGI